MNWLEFEEMVETQLIRTLKPQGNLDIARLINEVKKFYTCIYSRDTPYDLGREVMRLVDRADELKQLDVSGDYFNRALQLGAKLLKENTSEKAIPDTLESTIFNAIEFTYAETKHKREQEEVSTVFLEAISTMRSKRSTLIDSNKESRS